MIDLNNELYNTNCIESISPMECIKKEYQPEVYQFHIVTSSGKYIYINDFNQKTIEDKMKLIISRINEKGG